MIQEVNIISRKATVASAKGAGGSRRGLIFTNFLGSTEHLEWLKIDLNTAKTRTVQDYICTKT